MSSKLDEIESSDGNQLPCVTLLNLPGSSGFVVKKQLELGGKRRKEPCSPRQLCLFGGAYSRLFQGKVLFVLFST